MNRHRCTHVLGSCIRHCGGCRRSTSCAASRPPAGACSFTLAAEELFLTQSALSRQVKALEDALGVALFERRHRSARADGGRRRLPSHGRRQRCAISPPPPSACAHATRRPGLTRVHDRVLRLAVADSRGCRPFAPRIRTSRCTLRGRPPRRPRARRRRRRGPLPRAMQARPPAPCGSSASGCCRSSAPALVSAARAAAPSRATSRATCCSTSTIPEAACRGSIGRRGSRRTVQPALKPAGTLRFSLYDQVIQAAVGGQGVALGRIPLIAELLRRRPAGRAVSPSATTRRAATTRGWRRTRRGRPDVAAFVAFLEAAAPRRRTRRAASCAPRATHGAGTPPVESTALRTTAATVCARPRHDRCTRRSRPRRGSCASPSSSRAGARVLDLAVRRAAATRASSPRAARASSPSTATPTRSRRWRACRGVDRARVPISKAAPGRFAASASTRSSSSNYLHRPLFAPLLAALAPDGVLLYETFARGQRGLRPAANPDFLLRRGRAAGRSPRDARPDGRRVRAGRRRRAQGATAVRRSARGRSGAAAPLAAGAAACGGRASAASAASGESG